MGIVPASQRPSMNRGRSRGPGVFCMARLLQRGQPGFQTTVCISGGPGGTCSCWIPALEVNLWGRAASSACLVPGLFWYGKPQRGVTAISFLLRICSSLPPAFWGSRLEEASGHRGNVHLLSRTRCEGRSLLLIPHGPATPRLS